MELGTLIKAGYPLLAVKTQEPLRFTVEAARAGTRKIYQWDALRGVNEIGSTYWEELSPFELPDRAAEKPGSVWIVNNYQFFIKEPAVIQGIQNNIPKYKAQAITLIIVGPGFEAPPELARDIREITFDLPDRGDLGAVLDALASGQGVDLDPENRDQVIDNLQGLTWEEAENALAWGLVTDKGFNPLTIGKVKGQMVSASAGLSFSTFPETLESLVGNENLKTWTLNRFARRRAGFTGRTAPPFRGILLLGKPGNGKSHFAKALGRSVGWPTVILDLGRLLGSLVGQSEENAERTFRIIDAVAPCILFIDELEKALSGIGGAGDGGTSMRVAAKFLTWLQDHESEVFVVATCNDIKALSGASDGAFTRAGRWDAIFFIDNPEPAQAAGILNLYLEEFTGKPLAEYPGPGPELRDYSGAEIRQIAVETAYNGGDLNAAAQFVIPQSKSNKAALDALTAWAAGRTIPAHLTGAPATGRAITL
jgi:hypothetical protein